MESAVTQVRDYYSVKALSNSGIKQILRSPRHFKLWEEQQKKTSDAMRIGTAVHSYVLDGRREFPIFGGETKTLKSKAGEGFLSTYPDGLTYEEHLQVVAMGESILGNEKVRKLLDNCQREVAIYGQEVTDHSEGCPVKALLDCVSPGLILDLKTTSDPATQFHWAARKYDYDIQAAWYRHMAYSHLDGKLRSFYFGVVESVPPYGFMLYEAGDEFMERGLDRCLKALHLYDKCRVEDVWPCYSLDSIPVL
jgi:PDDEXK-like domain of unknown function (DUF3799)